MNNSAKVNKNLKVNKKAFLYKILYKKNLNLKDVNNYYKKT